MPPPAEGPPSFPESLSGQGLHWVLDVPYPHPAPLISGPSLLPSPVIITTPVVGRLGGEGGGPPRPFEVLCQVPSPTH